MKVFKFGGASIKDSDAIKNVAEIIAEYHNEKILVVISALGKTTNALEEIVDAFSNKNNEVAKGKINELKENHFSIASKLIGDSNHPLFEELGHLFEELSLTPKRYDTNNYNFLYDQVVCFGELFSTKIVSHYLNHLGIKNHWLDVRTVIKTDDAHREAKINWAVTGTQISEVVNPLINSYFVITQGFIGSTSDNHTTTLGREGSDFTAAIFSNVLKAEELVIWKDVPGVLNANPNLFNDVVKINSLPYEEAIEMTYYGAQVIHPKTIKPLQNKNIPLHVRSFIEKGQPGTIISRTELSKDIPPIIVYKKNQVLLLFSTKDFSFMAEQNLVEIYGVFARLRIDMNVMQNAAITLSVCVNYNENKLKELLTELQPHFNITTDKEVEVLTIRHYNEEIVDRLTEGKDILITQKTKNTVQFVYK